MENAVKKTKAMYFEELREMVMNLVDEHEKQDEMLDFIDKQLEALAKRKETAAKRAAAKKAESDELTEAIFAVLGEIPMTLDGILARFSENEEVTRNKISSRLGKLVRAGRVEKMPVAIEGAKGKRMSYKVAAAA